MTDILRFKLNAAFVTLQKFDHFAKPNDFMEVSLWHNDKGFDVHLSSHGDQFLQLSWGQFKALKKLVKELDNG